MDQSVKPQWRSLLVPSVQELAKKDISEVPPRYDRTDLILSYQNQKLIIYQKSQSLISRDCSLKKKMNNQVLLNWPSFTLLAKNGDSSRETLELYSVQMKNLAMAMIEQMGKAPNMEDMEIREMFEDGMQEMRMNYYPPCPQPHRAIGLTPHSDAVALTILLQLNEVQGLQIRKDGKWIPVQPLPNAFILNIGDILEIISNGIYRSIEHRATVNLEKERLSIATFYSPRYDAVIGPSQSLVSQQIPPQFKRIGLEDYLKGLFSRQLDQKSHLDAMRIDHFDSPKS